ncbi:MAG TPA: type II toxin-antitoxin system RelE/ParE family toxin [Fimbriimonas sp.]|nr:type II toxin-antitoxin system RelE/ParE family toxin [Fimbriimonas sp.]
MTIRVSTEAHLELQAIWAYNAIHRSEAEADAYLAFLSAGIDNLAEDYVFAKRVEGHSELFALALKKRSRSDGHIIVFTVDAAQEIIEVVRIYHSKMDMQRRLREDL